MIFCSKLSGKNYIFLSVEHENNVFINFILIRCDYTTIGEPTDEDYNDYTGDFSAETGDVTEVNELDHNSTPNNIVSPTLSALITSSHEITSTPSFLSSFATIKPPTLRSATGTKNHNLLKQIYIIFIDQILIDFSEKCPTKCVCNDNLRLIDCSNQGLQEIPPAFPSHAIKIDLSNNQLTRLNVASLQNCVELRALILSNNKIETIDENKVSIRQYNIYNLSIKPILINPLFFRFVLSSDSYLQNFNA